jgi:NifU-like protein involved in Fe-S cluster formation
MLKEGGEPPSGVRWGDLAMLEPIRGYPQRHASTMLVFEAVCACLDEIL